MHIARISVPYVLTFDFEWKGVTRGRTYIDGAINPQGAELWVGDMHIYIDRCQRRLPRAVTAVGFLVALATSPGMLGMKSVDQVIRDNFWVDTSVAADGPLTRRYPQLPDGLDVASLKKIVVGACN